MIAELPPSAGHRHLVPFDSPACPTVPPPRAALLGASVRRRLVLGAVDWAFG